MPKQIFVNLPVKDIVKSKEFFAKLGFTCNEQFTDATAACMIVCETIYVMLLTEPKFRSLTPKEICATSTHTEVLLCVTCDSRQQVTDLVTTALAAGGKRQHEPEDHGFMYHDNFIDLDGHNWGLIYMEPDAIK